MSPPTAKLNLEAGQVGVAGEYFVAAELSLRGYLATVTLRNTRGIDIIASTKDGEKTVNIQVKTCNKRMPTWILNKKAETFYSDNHFYVFVILANLEDKPHYYVVPSSVVALTVRKSHAKWLEGVKVNGEARKDSNIRKFNLKPDSEYRDAWESLFEFESF